MRNLFGFTDFNKLARDIQRGDRVAASRLYEELFDKVFGFCMNRVGHFHLAEDLTQEIFLKLVDKIETYNPNRGNFLVWFWQLARNTIIDHYRKNRETHFSDVEESKLEGISGYSEQEKIHQKIEVQQIGQFLETLKEDERELFNLHYIAGLSYREISPILEKTEGTLRVSMNRLKEKVRKQFK